MCAARSLNYSASRPAFPLAPKLQLLVATSHAKPELGKQRTGNVRGLSACTMLSPDQSLLEFVRWGLAGAARDVYNGDTVRVFLWNVAIEKLPEAFYSALQPLSSQGRGV